MGSSTMTRQRRAKVNSEPAVVSPAPTPAIQRAASRSKRLSKGTRLGLVVAALLLGLALFRPLWHIGLIAPQYPEGIGLYIWADQITGQTMNVDGGFVMHW